MIETVGVVDQKKETVEGAFWTPLSANFNASQKCTVPIHLFFKEAIENPTEEELEIEKEFVDPELEEEPKEEETKKPEEENEEEPPPKELKSVSLNYDLKLKSGRANKKENIMISYNYIKRAKKLLQAYNEQVRIENKNKNKE